MLASNTLLNETLRATEVNDDKKKPGKSVPLKHVFYFEAIKLNRIQKIFGFFRNISINKIIKFDLHGHLREDRYTRIMTEMIKIKTKQNSVG